MHSLSSEKITAISRCYVGGCELKRVTESRCICRRVTLLHVQLHVFSLLLFATLGVYDEIFVGFIFFCILMDRNPLLMTFTRMKFTANDL